MGRLGCTIDGTLDVSKFNEPMPWIGIYVAAASAACAMAMAVDVFHGFRYRKFWFPCKFFSLNATTLTLIAVAIKLSVDLNTSMPRRHDQLAKLSSGVFICTVMGNFLPSLGTMENKEIIMNFMALAILVITAIVNICIQLATGVIFVFWRQHAIVMFVMLVLLAIFASSAVAIPTTKSYFELKYSKKIKLAVKECSDKTDVSVPKKLRDDLMRYWMMAHTSNPQFVMGRSATCTASGAFCLISAATLAQAMLRSYLIPRSFKFCHDESDYKWSTTLVLVTQTIAVAVGTIAPACRWFTAINFRCPIKANKACRCEFKIEHYWIKKLIQWKECPLALKICGRQGRKLAHNMKNQFLDFCIRMQTGIVLVSKLVRLISIFVVSRYLICCRWCNDLKRLLKGNNSVANDNSGSNSQPNPMLELRHFVMHLEGEEELVDLMMENNCDAPHHWIQMGKKKQPKYLIQLLEKSISSREFKGVNEFDSDHVPSFDSEEPPNCWALPVVTLTSIAAALPNIDPRSIKQLRNSVSEGLMYIKVVEDNLDDKRDVVNVRKASEIVWLGVDLYHKWLDVDLHKMALQGKGPKEVLETLADIAKNRFMEFRKKDISGCLRETPSKWPIKVLAANCMYRTCQTLVLDYESRDCKSSEILFERLSAMISDIMGACLTNLKQVISTLCHHSTIEEREESVRRAIILLGKTQEILKILDRQPLPSSDPDQLASIDNWRALSRQKVPPQFVSSSMDGNTDSTGSSDLYLTID
ncbi:unnamed protein product [Ilex paraguariensis]|uniref:Uncharacterized protein n=1 Tax=Ilex paraguariensis TaxID=185542 RepID=A0ABC8U0F2_9AQUA